MAVFLASMASDRNCFYYCDEHFSYIQSDIEKRIFGLMVERLGKNEQLIFTTHNSDMLDLNLPNHTVAFLRKEIEDDEYKVSVSFASDFLKRSTDSVKCAMENDVFGSLPEDSLLDELEVRNRWKYRICVYLAEGECEERLLKALTPKPALIAQVRVKKFNVIQNELNPGFPLRMDRGGESFRPYLCTVL